MSLQLRFQVSKNSNNIVWEQDNPRQFSIVLRMSFSLSNREDSKVRLIWHRRDLRLNDNELYSNLICDDIVRTNITSVSLYVFDKQHFEPRSSSVKSDTKESYDTILCGPHAAQALIEAVTSLRYRIRSIGGELLVRTGDPSVIVPQIAEEIEATEIVYSEEPGSYEHVLVQRIKQRYAFQDQYVHGVKKVKLISKIGYTLYHPDDLPSDPNEWDRLAHPKKKYSKKKKGHYASSYPQSSSCSASNFLDLVDISIDRFRGICRIMGDFRKAAKGCAIVRKPIDAPSCLLKPQSFDVAALRERVGSIPSLEDLMQPLLDAAKDKSLFGLSLETIKFIVQSAMKNRNISQLIGEEAALEKLNYFIDQGYAQSADRSRVDVSKENSSRLSVHFALGTLSPRTVYFKACGAAEGCDWLMSHLEMRDFFIYTAFASGNRFFSRGGLPLSKKHTPITWITPHDEPTSWERWATGKTQLPMVDAAMLELMSTGYCSNRVRQNVVSVLAKDLQIDWRAGAEWFQFLLEDHCVAANYGNWLYFSGVGPDPKNRHFRTVSQLKRYDPNGEYVKKWLPMLNQEKKEVAFRPWDFDIEGYDSPIVDPDTQYTWQDLQCLKENGRLFHDDV